MLFRPKDEGNKSMQVQAAPEIPENCIEMSCLKDCLNMLATGAYKEVLSCPKPISMLMRPAAQALQNRVASTLRTIVEIWVEQTAPLLSIAEMTGDMRELEQRAQAMASASEEMAASISEVARSAEVVSQESQSVKTELAGSVGSVGQAVKTMGDISGAFSQMKEKVEVLEKASEQIAQILKTIEQIASQTNLLALNATIEAARAGDAGKGFAVVAGEVKTLAKQTASATEEIRQRIGALQQGMSDMLTSMNEGAERVNNGSEVIKVVGDGIRSVGERVDAVVQKMVSVSSTVQEQAAVTSEVAGNITAIVQMADKTLSRIDQVTEGIEKSSTIVQSGLNEITKNPENVSQAAMLVQIAKSDHASFKKRIIDTLVGHENTKSGDVPDHRGCRLGKWYDTITDVSIRSLPAFVQLIEPHERVHKHGKAALDFHAKGDHAAALEAAKLLDKASGDVIDALNDLYEKLNAAAQTD